MEVVYLSGIRPSLSSSFSLHSMADGSEPISEVDEIQEVENLQECGQRALNNRDFPDAVRSYSDALEIDEQNRSSLAGRATAYLELDKFVSARQDVDKLLGLDPKNIQGHYLLGKSLQGLGHYKEALLAFTKALSLDQNAGTITHQVACSIGSIANQICDIPDKLQDKLSEMDSCKKLCEVGACLYHSRKFDLCIRVLNAAQKLQTDNKLVTMKILLTLGNAHSALKHKELGTSLYQECYLLALDCEDFRYQTKVLVNLGSLYLEMGNTHQAIIHYEKLLDLEATLREGDPQNPLPDYWNQELLCALHLNLSIAYKGIGAMQSAVTHAKIYVTMIQGKTFRKHAEAQAHQNIGLLHEVLGDYDRALHHYRKFLDLSKCEGNKNAIAQAYGCLGSVYGQLHNKTLAVTYHEQHIAMAKKLQDGKQVATSYEQLGDTYMALGDASKAVDSYMSMFRACTRSDFYLKTTSFCKLGKAYQALNKLQYSIYYYEQAKSIAEELDFNSLLAVCHYSLACLLQHSTQNKDLHQARKYLEQLIPTLEAKIQRHRDEDTYCSEELTAQLAECYDAMQGVQSKLGDSVECLQYAEACRRRMVIDRMSDPRGTELLPTYSESLPSHGPHGMWSMAKINRTVTQQNATVLCYTVLPNSLLIWLLRPGQGVTRFCNIQHHSKEVTLDETVRDLVRLINSGNKTEHLHYPSENRALPVRGADLDKTRKKNETLARHDGKEKFIRDLENEISKESPSEKEILNSEKPAARKLFDLLVAPVYDLLTSMDTDEPLVIIPDKEVSNCPFSALENWNGQRVFDSIRWTVVVSFDVLDRVAENELNHLRHEDDLEYERTRSRKGGLSAGVYRGYDMRDQREISGIPVTDSAHQHALNLRKCTNPRLITSGGHRSASGSLNPIPETSLSPDLVSRDVTLVLSGNEGLDSSKRRTLSTGSQDNRDLTKKPALGRGSAVKSRHPGKGFSPHPVYLAEIEEDPAMDSFLTDCTPPNLLMGSPRNRHHVLSANTLSTLTTRTSTNTDITTSDLIVPDFRQLSDLDSCVVIGNPLLPNSLCLHGREWRPPAELEQAQEECHIVADYLEVKAIVGEYATKGRFLDEMKTATVLHLATVICLKEGILAFSPSPGPPHEGPVPEKRYQVTTADILTTGLTSKLVVLSGGWSSYNRHVTPSGFLLPNIFLAAGAQCVVTLLWPIPHAALLKFYFHFYQSFNTGSYVTAAVKAAIGSLREDDRFSDVSCWASFVVIGQDVHIDLRHFRHAMLDQTLDRLEDESTRNMLQDPLNPESSRPTMTNTMQNLDELQKCVCLLLSQHSRRPDVVPGLIDLLENAWRRLEKKMKDTRATRLPDFLENSDAAIKLLSLTDFRFQARGAYVTSPYVIYPHWNKDDLLLPACNAVKALLDLVSEPSCIAAIFDLLPTSQSMISGLVDLLCLTKHSAELQLKVSDRTVKMLWRDDKVKAVLTSLGFHQIGILLSFSQVPSNRVLLSAALQLFLAVSAFKNPTLLHKLDAALLGDPYQPGYLSKADSVRLPSLTPMLLPRNQLRMTTPWLSVAESPEEMDEKIKLARGKTEMTAEYRADLTRTKTWHQASLRTQGNEALDSVGRPKTTPLKVKVVSGSSASKSRVPVDQAPLLTRSQTGQRRSDARAALLQRLENLAVKHGNDVRKLYLPYIQTA